MWGGAKFTARAVARIGQLMLNRGTWNGTELVLSGAVDEITSYAATRVPVSENHPVSGAGWWSNINGVLRSLPCDAYIGAGSGQQILSVVPSEDLIIVRFGRRIGRDRWEGDFWDALDRQILAPAAKFFTEDKRSPEKCVK